MASKSKAFKKDWQRQQRGGKANLQKAAILMQIIDGGGVIPPQYVDHPLDQWRGYRGAHFGGDYVIIYYRDPNGQIVFDRIGSHNDIYG